MNDKVREALIVKIGTIMVANAELAVINEALGKESARLQSELDELRKAQPSLPLNDQPANPYELPAKPNGVH